MLGQPSPQGNKVSQLNIFNNYICFPSAILRRPPLHPMDVPSDAKRNKATAAALTIHQQPEAEKLYQHEQQQQHEIGQKFFLNTHFLKVFWTGSSF